MPTSPFFQGETQKEVPHPCIPLYQLLTTSARLTAHVATGMIPHMAKIMYVKSDDDYRAMIIFKGLLLMGIEHVPLDPPENLPTTPLKKEQEASCH